MGKVVKLNSYLLVGMACLIVFLFLCGMASAASSGNCGENATWTLDDNGLLTISGTGAMADEDNASLFQTDLVKKVVIENGITKIGNNAFRGCNQLISVSIPRSVTSIGFCAFQDCSQLLRVNLPNSITAMGSHVFYNCSNLVSITLPSGIKDLKKYFLSGCSSLESVALPSELETIGMYALARCVGLTSIVIPSKVNMIGDGAFSGDTSIMGTISIPNSVRTIGSYAFSEVKAKIIIEPGITTIGKNAFSNYKGTTLTIPEGVTTIEDGAFSQSEIETLIFPNSLTNIGKDLCRNTNWYTYVTIKADCDSYTYQWRKYATYQIYNDGMGYWKDRFYSFESLKHKEKVVTVKAPTCSSTGLKNTICEICGAEISMNEEIAIVDHDPVSDQNGIDPTCTETGLTDSTSCIYCGMEMSPQEVIPALGHDWDTAEYVWSEDNLTVIATHICKRDNAHTESETAQTTWEKTEDPDCEVFGENTYTAVFTKDGFTEQKKIVAEIDPIGHAWGNASYTWSADNSKVTAVHYCNHNRTHVEIETVQTTSTTTATCLEDGETTFTTGAFENPAFEMQSKTVSGTPALGHEWDSPSYSWSNDNSTVIAVRVCKRDSSHFEEELAISSSEITEPATCTGMGSTTYTVEFENQAFAAQNKTVQNIPAIGHSWMDATYTWSDDYRSVTAVRVCENNSEHKEVETVWTTFEIKVPAKCLEMGQTTYTAAFENQAFSTQTKCIENIPATGHRWGQPTYSWSENNLQVTAKHICLNDANHIETETAAVLSRTKTPPACTTFGETEYTATFSNAVFASQTKVLNDIPPIGHSWSDPVYQWNEDHSQITASRFCYHNRNHQETETVSTSFDYSINPTCTESGIANITSSAFSNAAFQQQTMENAVIPALSHKWHTPTYTWSEDNRFVTALRRCERDESHIETETVETTNTVTKADCPDEGELTYTSCSFSNSGFTVQTKKVSIPGEHLYITDSAIAPTYARTGLTAGLHCGRCGRVIIPQRVVPKIDTFKDELKGMKMLRLPASLSRVEEQAFMGSSVEAVVVPESCRYIDSKAFANCSALKYVILQSDNVSIAADAFDGSGDARTVVVDLSEDLEPLFYYHTSSRQCYWIHELFGKTIKQANMLLEDELVYGDGFYYNDYFGVQVDDQGHINWISVFNGKKYSLFNSLLGEGAQTVPNIRGCQQALYYWEPDSSLVNPAYLTSKIYPDRIIMLTWKNYRLESITYGVY